jgi:hypothetical protein
VTGCPHDSKTLVRCARVSPATCCRPRRAYLIRYVSAIADLATVALLVGVVLALVWLSQ